jgi:hypothetical protein
MKCMINQSITDGHEATHPHHPHQTPVSYLRAAPLACICPSPYAVLSAPTCLQLPEVLMVVGA